MLFMIRRFLTQGTGTGLEGQETGAGLRERPVVELLGLNEEEDCLC